MLGSRVVVLRSTCSIVLFGQLVVSPPIHVDKSASGIIPEVIVIGYCSMDVSA